jgi:phospholipid-binding lipoprotein MlaA
MVVLAVAVGGCASIGGPPPEVVAMPSPADGAPFTEVARSDAPSAAPVPDVVAAQVSPVSMETDSRVVSETDSRVGTETASPLVAVAGADSPLLAADAYRLTEDADQMPSSTGVRLAQSTGETLPGVDQVDEEYDPWEPFNERMFEFNRRLDRYLLKPVATAYNVVVPDRVQIMIANGFDNINFVPRMMNSLFQGKFDGAVREFGRFVFNSTIGIGGLFDVAKMEGIEKSREDFGQTLGFYGVTAGPYLILPFFEPLTVRDGVGRAVDGFMDPLSYFVPFFYTRLLLKVEETINDRSLNLELFQGFEESVVDMYSAVRHAYLKRREKLVRE